jgi:arylsulfatase A-like enzyme
MTPRDRHDGSRRPLRLLALAGLLGLATACGGGPDEVEPAAKGRPNIIWIVWDTTRADRMSLYGHSRETTPFLEEWTKDARVFENCVSTASSTVPSHAAMFTGKLPSEHGTFFGHQWLDDHHQTAAELLRDSGYQTYLWAANPHVSVAENFNQGFEVEEHPWDQKYMKRAFRIVLSKVEGDKSSEMAERIASGNANAWMIKAAGQLAEVGLTKWLDQRDPERPYFAFLNYMEAHRPFIPPRRYRERMMTPEQVERSYVTDRSWVPMWAYTFGLKEYTEEELEIMAATYDATLAELDDLFQSLVTTLEARGELDNTVILLTGDHGEHLGEHHMLDHQFSLYNPLVRVPMVLWAPGRVEPGRDGRPVANFDAFPTVLELAGVDLPEGLQTTTVSLLSPQEDRPLLSELPATFTEPFLPVAESYPEFDPNRWKRRLRAFQYGDYKLIWSDTGDHELYDISSDRLEVNDLFESDPERAQALLAELDRFVALMQDPAEHSGTRGSVDPKYLQMLRDLGYVSDGAEAEQGKDWELREDD